MTDRWLRTRQTLAEVAHERTLQERKWGSQHHTPERWITILGEEYGEAASAALHQVLNNQGEVTVGSGDLRAELIQVAAVAIAAVEDIDAGQEDLDFYSLGLSWPAL